GAADRGDRHRDAVPVHLRRGDELRRPGVGVIGPTVPDRVLRRRLHLDPQRRGDHPGVAGLGRDHCGGHPPVPSVLGDARLRSGAGVIPIFIRVRELGLLNSYWALILPLLISPFNMVVMRAFFMGLPQELLESARIDGASELRVFLQMVLPLSKAVIAVIALFYAVGYWNVFFNAMIYIHDTEKWPIQVVLNQYVVQNSDLAQVTNPDKPPPPSATVQNAVIVLATVPILCVYPFVQKYFTKGVLTGAIKG